MALTTAEGCAVLLDVKEVEVLSVGVDVGSATSHMVFSRLLLERDERSETRRFEIRRRRVVHQGRILPTPLADDRTLDTEALSAYLAAEYRRAGIAPEEVQTGAVIVTGESARKENAAQLAAALSDDAGKFVAAAAGPNFESLLAALGSGAAAISAREGSTLVNCDIGGGTANLALVENGRVAATSCVAVGGRLLGVDAGGRIWRLDPPARQVLDELGLDCRVGDTLAEAALKQVACRMAEVLVEALTGPVRSALGRRLMLTGDLPLSPKVDGWCFSGGVAELMYGPPARHGDIGHLLAAELRERLARLRLPLVEPANKIRATVIGAGAYSLSISGSSGFMDEGLRFPIRNVPVLRVDIDETALENGQLAAAVRRAFQRFDLTEGRDVVALYFEDPVRASYPRLERFSRALEAALPNTVRNRLPVILIFGTDIACSVGNVMRRETGLRHNLLSLDELRLEEGDWIDIGAPLVSGQVFPVTVKSLVFYEG